MIDDNMDGLQQLLDELVQARAQYDHKIETVLHSDWDDNTIKLFLFDDLHRLVVLETVLINMMIEKAALAERLGWRVQGGQPDKRNQ